MKPEIRKKYLSALRSGHYKQTREVLREDGCYCALGLLCELFRRETGVGAWRPAKDIWGLGSASHDYFTVPDEPPRFGCIPVAVAEWAGIRRFPVVGDFEISDWNDNGLTFRQLARKIEMVGVI